MLRNLLINAIKMTHSSDMIRISHRAGAYLRKKMEDDIMKRRICAWMLAAAAALSLTTPVTAAVSRKIVNPVHFYADKDGDGICDNFTDKNKDGICDNCAWGRGQGRYAGRYFADENGDGICDNYANGCGRGYGCGRGMGYGRGRF